MELNNVQDVIAALRAAAVIRFTSHDFIMKYMVMYERKYVELLYNHRDSGNGIIRTAHAEIGRFLSDNAEELGISKTQRCDDMNIHGNVTENQEWKL